MTKIYFAEETAEELIIMLAEIISEADSSILVRCAIDNTVRRIPKSFEVSRDSEPSEAVQSLSKSLAVNS